MELDYRLRPGLSAADVTYTANFEKRCCHMPYALGSSEIATPPALFPIACDGGPAGMRCRGCAHSHVRCGGSWLAISTCISSTYNDTDVCQPSTRVAHQNALALGLWVRPTRRGAPLSPEHRARSCQQGWGQTAWAAASHNAFTPERSRALTSVSSTSSFRCGASSR